MEYSEIAKLTSTLDGFGIGTLIGIAALFLLQKFFLNSYLSEKGKNLASKEDIELITDKVESVKSDYTHLLEEIKNGHQMELAAIERDRNTKKEVYMEAVESITRCQNIINGFANLNTNEEQILSNMNFDAGKIAKIQVVGSTETVKTVSKFMNEFGKSYLDLMLKRSGLMQRKHSIHTHESLSNKAQQEIDRYVAIMKNLNLQGDTDERLWDTVNRNIDHEQEQFDKHQATLEELWSLQNKEIIEFTRECMDRFFKTSALLPPVVLAIRSELDLNIASEDYLDIYNKNIDESKQIFEDFLHRLAQLNSHTPT